MAVAEKTKQSYVFDHKLTDEEIGLYGTSS